MDWLCRERYGGDIYDGDRFADDSFGVDRYGCYRINLATGLKVTIAEATCYAETVLQVIG